MFDKVEPTFDLPKLEHKILKYWAETDAFQKLLALNKRRKCWSFLDGPITANNPMGVHHARGRTYKDAFRRYKIMTGYCDRYQNGFDVQGLWVEVEVEKELGFKSKQDIEAYGIAEFVKRCKQRALRCAAKQVEQSIRLGHWMSWENPETLIYLADSLEDPEHVVTIQGPNGPVTDTVERIVGKLGTPETGGSYFTFSDENNYMIWMFLKKCYENGWVYKGVDVMPWCPRCSTGISQHEILTDGYREVAHTALFVKLPLRERPGESLLIWTTTPWTLTSNVAAAVNPDLDYAKVEYKGELFYLAQKTLERVLPKGSYKIVEELKGNNMEGWTYDGPFDELPTEREKEAVKNHRVILWKDVSEEEGTGIVHIAPGCGKEDLELGKLHGLPVVSPLDEFGVFTKGFGRFTGFSVYETASIVVDDLKKKRLLIKTEEYRHRYPVCWRCGNELVFRLVDEWFIRMGEKLTKPFEELTKEEKEKNLRYSIMESAKQTRWIPPFGLLQELDWLSNMEDWMISKKRYWGLALPIWTCSNCGNFEVIGSEEELKERAVEGWEVFSGHTPHRPWIDAVKIKCPECGSLASRIPEVGNPWLDAGIVPYSTLNYRHDQEYWKKWFPPELVCESLPGQFRNWFYALLAMSAVLEKRAPFRICFGFGDVLGEDGREMHKSWGNAIWFDDAAETMGVDVMRWMYCSNRVEPNLLFGYNKAAEVRQRFLIPLWNIYSFFVTYANLDNWKPKKTATPKTLSTLDRWITSKLNVLIKDVTRHLDNYELYEAAVSLEKFVDELSKWYLRRSRRRFWKSEKDKDKNAAYTTLYTCLTTLVKLLAPLIPFVTEEMYQNLTRRADSNAPESVHHNDWPTVNETAIDQELMSEMDLVMRVCDLGRSARAKAGIKLRQPLSEVKVFADSATQERMEKFNNIILDELNVKNLSFAQDKNDLMEYTVRLRPETLGRKYGPLFPKLSEHVKRTDTRKFASTLQKGLVVKMKIDDNDFELHAEDVELSAQPKKDYSLSEEENILVSVNTAIKGELKMEGLARDIIRHIQNQRKAANFDTPDLIETYYKTGPELSKVFKTFGEYIGAETLSTSICQAEPPEDAHVAKVAISGKPLQIGLRRVKKGKQSTNASQEPESRLGL